MFGPTKADAGREILPARLVQTGPPPSIAVRAAGEPATRQLGHGAQPRPPARRDSGG